jgi:hypothetical protein
VNILARWGMPFVKAMVLAGGTYWLYGKTNAALNGDRLVVLAQLLASIGGTLLGFLITTISLVASLNDRTLIGNLRKTDHFDVLMRDAFVTVTLLLLLTLTSIISLFGGNDFLRAVLGLSTAIGVLAVTFAIETGIRFARVIRYV